MPANQSVKETLSQIAGGMEKLASAIETDARKTAEIHQPAYREPSVDYGSLGSETHAGTDALTRFLLT